MTAEGAGQPPRGGRDTAPMSIVAPPRPEEAWYLRFHDLMPYRVREILLVSSLYDAFILEEDGRLTDRLFIEYSELNLSQAPRITHAPSMKRAMALLRQRHFDLVLTMVHLGDLDVATLARRVKKVRPGTPVLLLAYSEAELRRHGARVAAGGVERALFWTGDTQVLVAAIKLVEDQLNVTHDTASAGVRVIVVVEDSVRYYTAFLSLLYAELLKQSGSLIAEGVNDLHKLMRMRARPKILLATDFEEALACCRRYRRYLFALISDVRFPREGRPDPEAGFALARRVRRWEPDLPVLLQSAEPELQARAKALGVNFALKGSPGLLEDIRHFLREGLGFGDFIFRLPDGTHVDRARDVNEMERKLATVPGASILHHGRHNHFSMWLMARSMFHLAEKLRPRRVEEFASVEELRGYIIEVLREARLQERAATITDFTAEAGYGEEESPFVRLGRGSIGGKARAVAFARVLLAREGLGRRYAERGLDIRVPRTIAVGTDAFDAFIEENDLHDARALGSDREILARFLGARLPEALLRNLRIASRTLSGPLAVRSSSLLEDSHVQPFAGIYATYLLANRDPDPARRHEVLFRAVKAVYASTFWRNARAYVASTPYAAEEEKMGVAVQAVVGQAYGRRFYPHFSGIARSYNFYPVPGQRPEDGVVEVALGLGHQVVGGGAALVFSPATPRVLPQMRSAREFVRHSQSSFYALDLDRAEPDFGAPPDASLLRCTLADAEADGTLRAVGSVYDPEDDTIRDDLRLPGPRVVTFNNILKWEVIPLAAALRDLLALFREGMSHAVEVEFAVDMGDWGRSPPAGREPRLPCLHVLQVRPATGELEGVDLDLFAIPREDLVCRTDSALGNGVIEAIRDVLYVPATAVAEGGSEAVVPGLDRLNGELVRAGRPYLLIGPGRWGSTHPQLGIPVEWAHIAGARVIVEAPFHERRVDPSQGSHFFHNLTSLRIGYLTVAPSGRGDAGRRWIDTAWLDAVPPARVVAGVRHLRFGAPLQVILDGRKGWGVVLKPGAAIPLPELA